VPNESWISPRYRTIVDFSSAYGQLTQPNPRTTVKTDIIHAGVEQDQYLSHRVFAFGAASWDHSLSQGLDLQQTYGGGLGWTVTNYIAKDGTLSGTSAPDGSKATSFPGVGGASGFIIADNLLNGPLAGIGMQLAEKHGRVHYLFDGLVDARATSIKIQLGPETQAAKLSPAVLTIPVRAPSSDALSEEGKKRLARMPPAINVRSYAATFTPDFLRGQNVTRAKIVTTLKDGSTNTTMSGPLCVSARCGFRPTHVR